MPGSTIRHGKWKLLIKTLTPGGQSGRDGKRPSAPAGSLFDLENDPGQTTNVSDKHPEIVADLTRRMGAAMKELEKNNLEIGKLDAVPHVEKAP